MMIANDTVAGQDFVKYPEALQMSVMMSRDRVSPSQLDGVSR